MRIAFSMSKRLGLNLCVSSQAVSEASNSPFIFSSCSFLKTVRLIFSLAKYPMFVTQCVVAASTAVFYRICALSNPASF